MANHFYELVPDMALDFPFELDKFQKEVAATPMAISPVKSAKKGKRHPEEFIKKQSATKKLKREVEEVVEKQKSGKKLKASFEVAPKKKPETSSFEDVSSSEAEKEVCSIEADRVFLYANVDVLCPTNSIS
ncbi:uncharacterized protein LOC131251117 isoform X2 [Magnolia sinica]|nr:uncharacterized protein LOC131251117 isoform X2 [Magnolia sinica]XP_058107618.1 uncharacterized protein LOC131251117 isoform X2 [Magnolia sinica]